MPSPFPRMDPYLEGNLWTTFHFAFAAEIIRQIAPQLRPHYLALPVERMVIEESGDVAITTASTYLDVSIVRGTRMPAPAEGQRPISESPLQLATIIPQAVPHVSIEIRDVARRQLVTAIEILSPTNKRGEGRLEYLTTRRRLLLSTAHLIEIDLLCQGERVPMQQPLPEAPYFVLLSRTERRPLMDIWPISLDRPLPTVPLPLLPGDAELPLDLQAVFNATYDLLGYDLILNYDQQPEIPLDSPLALWADALLRAHGLRNHAA